MNALVKKEIRLLLPGWIVAVLLALPPICTRSDDGIPVFLLFMGLVMLALTSIGRETSLNTFSSLLAQPAERMRIWKIKLSVLAAAFLAVFAVWRLAIIFSFKDYMGSVADPEASAAVLVAGSLVLVSTFTGGLWATLLLRQIAGAFWLALLVPATLAGFTAAFLAESQPDSGVIAALCVILGIYSVGGFLFARWLFFRAQDVGWTGGIIALPEWKIFSARSDVGASARNRRPFFALLKKEIQLQQVSLMGAAGLLGLHIGVIVLRANHKFARESAGEVLTAIFWILWLVMPVIVGAMSVAEERRLGVLEGQLCLPASRRVQFVIKGFLTLFLGILLGGVMPCLLETIGGASGWLKMSGDAGGFKLAIIGLAATLALVSFFASSLARNFLQAVGYAIGTFVGFTLFFSALMKGRMFFFDAVPMGAILPAVIATPTWILTLLLLSYLNFKNFHDGWHLWRRNLLGALGAILFVAASSAALYNRVWEVLEPAEPAHGPAKLSLANPPTLQMAQFNNLLVRLPDGRVWFDTFHDYYNGDDGEHVRWKYLCQILLHPLPASAGPQRFVAGSNWVAATTKRVNFARYTLPSGKRVDSEGYFDTVGIQPDGTLWVSGKSEQYQWTADTLRPFGNETNWQQLAQSRTSVVLLKNDGTLWRWGSVSNEWTDWVHQWPGLRAFEPYQIGTNSDWSELFTLGGNFARQADGRAWSLNVNWKTGKDELNRATNFDGIISRTASTLGEQHTAFVRPDGTLWVLNRYWDQKHGQMTGAGILQVGKENDWRAVAVSYHMMAALKADGSLWQWNLKNSFVIESVNLSPTRLGIHTDWVAIKNTWGGVIACAADGSLWLWPDRKFYDYDALIKLPKQPRSLGNVFNTPN
jgi:hypothetical protein